MNTDLNIAYDREEMFLRGIAGRSGIPSTRYNRKELYLAEIYDRIGGKRPYVSLERNGEYLYTVTFDALPEYQGAAPLTGACSAFVRDGKLYRNLDWLYNNNLSFRVITKDFEGMSFIDGLTSTTITNDKIAQLPYRVVDGVNRHGIMVSTHVVYNDWEWAGEGNTPITKLPFLVLSNVTSMNTMSQELAEILPDLVATPAVQASGYLIQVLVTDGTTTKAILPPTDGGNYSIVDATANPKMTNFRWVADSSVVRTDLQDRPTGVERWNEIDADTTLEDLRFTKAYESPARLSEFIGINDTTKDSTDAELTAIYDLAHAEYQNRKRDGKLWQTMHSVVYGANGIEQLYVQEDWGSNYSGGAAEIELTGDSGRLTAEQIALVQNDFTILVNNGNLYRLSSKNPDLTYRTFTNIDTSEALVVRAIYVQLNKEAVNYGTWSMEELPIGG